MDSISCSRFMLPLPLSDSQTHEKAYYKRQVLSQVQQPLAAAPCSASQKAEKPQVPIFSGLRSVFQILPMSSDPYLKSSLIFSIIGGGITACPTWTHFLYCVPPLSRPALVAPGGSFFCISVFNMISTRFSTCPQVFPQNFRCVFRAVPPHPRMYFASWSLVFGVWSLVLVFSGIRPHTHVYASTVAIPPARLSGLFFCPALPVPAGLYRLFSLVALLLVGGCIQVDLLADIRPD